MSFRLPPVEVCLDSADSAVAAQAGGARRVELCDNLIEGGTTPSLGSIRATRRAIDIDMMVMIRPRGGDFCYSPLEVEAMLADIEVARAEGATGVVFGVLTTEGEVDRALTARLVEAAGPLQVTFHRAFDMCRDPFAAMEVLVELGVHRILTSGQEPSVLEGLDLIVELIERAGERISIMPGCGITPRNVQRICMQANPREIHVVGVESQASPMRYRNDRVYMGTELRSPEYLRPVTSAERIRDFFRVGGEG